MKTFKQVLDEGKDDISGLSLDKIAKEIVTQLGNSKVKGYKTMVRGKTIILKKGDTIVHLQPEKDKLVFTGPNDIGVLKMGERMSINDLVDVLLTVVG